MIDRRTFSTTLIAAVATSLFVRASTAQGQTAPDPEDMSILDGLNDRRCG
jgi:hypothetical protein